MLLSYKGSMACSLALVIVRIQRFPSPTETRVALESHLLTGSIKRFISVSAMRLFSGVSGFLCFLDGDQHIVSRHIEPPHCVVDIFERLHAHVALLSNDLP